MMGEVKPAPGARGAGRLGTKELELFDDGWRFETLRGIGGGERGFSKLSLLFDGKRGETGGDSIGVRPPVEAGGERLPWYDAPEACC